MKNLTNEELLCFLSNAKKAIENLENRYRKSRSDIKNYYINKMIDEAVTHKLEIMEELKNRNIPH